MPPSPPPPNDTPAAARQRPSAGRPRATATRGRAFSAGDMAIADAERNELQDPLTLAVADARHVISRMEVGELRQLTAAIADDAFEQFARIRTAIVATNGTALAASFIAIADAWEAAHAARIAVCQDDE